MNSIGTHLALYYLVVDILEHRSETTLSTIFGHPSESFENNPWKALLEEAAPSALSQPPLSPLCFIDEPETDSQVWVFANIQHRTLCIAFRGTEQDSWRDMLTDISMAPALVEPGKIPELCNHSGLAATAKQPSLMQDLMKRLKSARKQLESDEDGEKDEQSSSPKDGAAFWKGLLEGKRRDGPRARQILEQLWRAVYESDLSGAFRTGGLTAEDMQAQPWVHQGFLTAYDSVRSAVMEMAELAMIRTKRREGSGSWRVLVTGHSLGGALATLCAYDLALHRWPEGVVAPQISMYNYGSPRVGNRKFAKVVRRWRENC